MTSIIRGILSIFVIVSLITLSFIGLLVINGLVNNPGVSAASITVAKDSGGDYSTIQEAIDNASTGDTIYVWDGVYYENIEINKTLSLIGNGSATTFINGSQSSDVVNITADWVNITGFTIQYSGIQSGTPFLMDCGIDIYYADYVHIYEINCSASMCGIFSSYSHYGLFENNTIGWNAQIGLVIYYSENNTIQYNNIRTNGQVSITIFHANTNKILYNKCKNNNQAGIHLIRSLYSTVIRNNCSDNRYSGMEIYSSSNSSIIENICNGHQRVGISTDYSNDVYIFNNTCNYNKDGIETWECTRNELIANTCNYNSGVGLYIEYYSFDSIIGNKCNNNLGEGIEIWDSSYNNVKNNLCESNGNSGIIIYSSNANNFTNNTLQKNIDGFILERVQISSFYNNTCASNTNNGIQVSGSMDNYFQFNNISNNNHGIYIDSQSSHNRMIENLISFNSVNGIYISSGCNLNTVYHNLIISNTNQATDSGSNSWSHNEEGNYWSDYTGLDNGNNERMMGDGIGDTNLPHPGPGMDSYPFIKPYGWLYPGIPVLLDPGEISITGDFKIIWYETVRALGYTLEEDTTETFETATEIFNDTDHDKILLIEDKPVGTYYYRAKAYNEKYVSDWSNIVNITVDGPPAKPLGLTYYNITAHNVTLEWTPNTDSDLYGYHILINNPDMPPPFIWLATVPATQTQYTVTNLIEETTYLFAIIAFDIYQLNSTMSEEVKLRTSDATAPAAPTGLEAHSKSDTEIQLTWTANKESDISGYLIFMNETGSGPTGQFIQVEVLNSSYTSFIVKGLAEQTKYYFKIKAYDEVPNNSSFSNVTSATTFDLTPPTAPEGLKIINHTINSLTLIWNASPELDVEGYFIYQGSVKDGQFKKLNNESLIELQYIDKDLEENTRYYYKIQTIDDVGLNSSFSAIITGVTLLGPKPPEINNSIDSVKFAEDSYDNTSIKLYEIFEDPNSDPLIFTVEGEDYLTVTIFQNNGTVIIHPEPDWSGKESLTFYASDGTKEISLKVTVTVTPVNDPPGPAKIVSFDDGLKIMEGEIIDLEGECNDIDIPYGDELTFKWSSSKSGFISTGQVVENIELVPGKHLITLEVSDKDGMTSNANATVIVQKKNGSDAGTMGYIYTSVIVVIIVIILILVFLFMRKKKRQKSVEKGKDKEKKDMETPQQIQQSVQPPVAPSLPPTIPPGMGMPGMLGMPGLPGMPPASMPPLIMPMPMQVPLPTQPFPQPQIQLQQPAAVLPNQDPKQLESSKNQPDKQSTKELSPESSNQDQQH